MLYRVYAVHRFGGPHAESSLVARVLHSGTSRSTSTMFLHSGTIVDPLVRCVDM